MRLSVVGSDYLALVTAIYMAEAGYQLLVDTRNVGTLNAEDVPIYELDGADISQRMVGKHVFDV